MKLVLAEKPSVAREIASILGASEKKEGYLKGNDYCVSWAFGHLISLAMPEDYGFIGFKRENLPIVPHPFLLTTRKIKKGKEYVIENGALKQLKIIEQLFHQCESIIVATDAGREGELIFRYIYEYLQCKKPFERLWISSLTEKSISQGFKTLKPGKEFDGLYYAAQSRSRADWLVGINSSQALSIAAGEGIYSLGRVQTPTLSLICKRFYDHNNFTEQKFWQIQLVHQKDFIEFKSLGKTKFSEKREAENIIKSIERNSNSAIVQSIEIKNITEQAPLLFDLTGLQKEANKKLNLSAEETLNIAQSLYEKKFITYPRTGSKYIPEDVWSEIPDLLRALKDREHYKKSVNSLPLGNLNKKIVNGVKVTDHHGLLTTSNIPSSLSAKEMSIYNLIAFRLLESVCYPCIKEMTEVNLQVLHYDFITKGCKILQQGWRNVQGNFSGDTHLLQELPVLKVSTELKIKTIGLLEKKTQPPALYTEAELLTAMENTGKQIEDDEKRSAMKDIGIGTPATRAAIIETLLNRAYIIRNKKSLTPTQKGLQVFELVKDKKISNAEMTAEWELVMQKIENEELSADDFEKNIEQYVAGITQELLQISLLQPDLPMLLCPKCKAQHLLIKETIVKCKDEKCNWIQFRNICGVQLTTNDIESLIKTGKTTLIKGMKSKAGKKFDAHIKLADDFKTIFEF